MTAPRRHLAALLLLTVACVWFLGGVAAAVHFRDVAHAVDPHSGEVVHPHHEDCSHGHATDERKRAMAEHRGSGSAGDDPCVHVGLALHAAGLAAGGGIAGVALARATTRLPSDPHHAHPPVELLDRAPKLPPPLPA